MPNLNGKGPMGQGSMTGKKLGKCNKSNLNISTESDEAGNVTITGFGRGINGRGKGFRNRFGGGRRRGFGGAGKGFVSGKE